MARTKKEEVMENQIQESSVNMEPVKQTLIDVELVGTSDLILNKKCRSYERSEIWKQTNPKGSKMPKILDQEYNLWEHLITSITWDKPITFHDEDYSLYTQEEWEQYMRENNPCILSAAFMGAMGEAFKTFGFKDSTGKAGTDFKRAVNFQSPKNPITFAGVTYEQKLIPTTGITRTNVVSQYNVFSGWKCNVTLACADVVFPYETIIELLGTTGRFIGVGTQHKNGFGHFEIGKTSIKEGMIL